MEAPDKVNLNPILYCKGFFLKPSKETTEYLRKEALLEWAKEKQYESLTIVADNFWQVVIDKLNKM